MTPEPANFTGWIDDAGDTWVRDDTTPGMYGNWWPITDGPGWEPWGRDKVGQAREWVDVEEHGPFTPADSERTAKSLRMVREQVTR